MLVLCGEYVWIYGTVWVMNEYCHEWEQPGMSKWCGLNEIVESKLTLQKQIESRADNRVPVEYTTRVRDKLLWVWRKALVSYMYVTSVVPTYDVIVYTCMVLVKELEWTCYKYSYTLCGSLSLCKYGKCWAMMLFLQAGDVQIVLVWPSSNVV